MSKYDYDKVIHLLNIKNNLKEKENINILLNNLIEERKNYINHYISGNSNKLMYLIFEKNYWLVPWIEKNNKFFNKPNILIYHSMYSTKEVFETNLNNYLKDKDSRDFYINFKYSSERRYTNLQKLFHIRHDNMDDLLLQAAIITRNKENILFLLKNRTFLKTHPFVVHYDLYKEDADNLKFFNSIYPKINIVLNMEMPKNINEEKLTKIINNLPFLNKIPSGFSTKINIYETILSNLSYFRKYKDTVKNMDINNIEWQWQKSIIFKAFSELLKENLLNMTSEDLSCIPDNIVLTSRGYSKELSNSNSIYGLLSDKDILNFLSSNNIQNEIKENFLKLKWKISGKNLIDFVIQKGNNIPLNFFKGHLSLDEIELEKTLNIKNLIDFFFTASESTAKEILLLLLDSYKKIEPETSTSYYDFLEQHLYFYSLNRNSECTNILINSGCFDYDKIHYFLLKGIQKYLSDSRYKPQKDINFYIDNVLALSNHHFRGFDFIKHSDFYIDDRVDEIKNHLIEKENEILKMNIKSSETGIVKKKRI